jgi:hypothetical protein
MYVGGIQLVFGTTRAKGLWLVDLSVLIVLYHVALSVVHELGHILFALPPWILHVSACHILLRSLLHCLVQYFIVDELHWCMCCRL